MPPKINRGKTDWSSLAKPVSVSVQETLNQRAKTHGDFRENGRIMQHLKQAMRGQGSWANLDPHQREALEMIQHKIGRILCGNPNEADHWRDIAGYATLCQQIIEGTYAP